MTKEEMFNWIVDNNAQISRCPTSLWTREDGSKFYCNFGLSSRDTQWPAAPTLAEAIQFANRYQQENV